MNTCWRCIDNIIFEKLEFLARVFFANLPRWEIEYTLPLARSTTSSAMSQHVHKVPPTPSRLHISVCSTWAFVALVFGALAFAVRDCWIIVLWVSTWAFVAWVFGGWSFGGYCQGVIRYKRACQAPADTAKAWLDIEEHAASLGRYCQGVIRYRRACQAPADTAKVWQDIE